MVFLTQVNLQGSEASTLFREGIRKTFKRCDIIVAQYTVPANRPFRPVFASSEIISLRKSNRLKGHNFATGNRPSGF